MTTGSTIYLVSACASGEEFVAAFRRYADKNGLFVPIGEPLYIPEFDGLVVHQKILQSVK